MKKVSIVGIDLAKNSFQIHGVDKKSQKLFNKKISRNSLLEKINKLEKDDNFVIVMEACASAHYWGREFRKLGYEVKLIAAKFVKPFVKANKNDATDAEAIVEAASRPSMRFVAIKSEEQQFIQSLHRIREGIVKRKTAVANEIRGILLEYGFIIKQGIGNIRKEIYEILASEELYEPIKILIQKLYSELITTMDEVAQLDKKLLMICNENEICNRISKIEGVGPIIATAIFAAVGDSKAFKNGREFSAWLGLVPRQHSTGGKPYLLGISKRGDSYIRKNLVHGCRSVVRWAETKVDKKSLWINSKVESRGKNKATVALANKTARVIWAVMANNTEYTALYRAA